ncbi:MAG: hypothetical protein HLUCCA04_12145 [Oceanicaulis sp. HLUCCA04]|nr:MAG: hypothetical protein HLUCCA04_12145 [Oceanicaulis sp. HLUCCA04]
MSKVTKQRSGPSGFVLGRQAFARISAVEGLVLTPGMQADFAELDRAQADAATRRRQLRKRYAG